MISTNLINQMNLSAFVAAAAVIGASFIAVNPASAQNYYGRTRPTFSNPAGREYSTYRNPYYNSFGRNRNSYGSNGFHGNCTGYTCRRYR